MKCQEARERITNMLAAGGLELATVLRGHVESCSACGTFYAQQAELFRALDSGLRAMANQSVPASLLPRVRAQMEEKVTRPGWVSNPLMLAAAMAVVLLAAIFFPHARKKPLELPVAAVPAFSNDRQEVHQHRANEAATKIPPQGAKVIRAKANRTAEIQNTAAAPEVIVLRQEREAFARFLAELPTEREVAVALTQAAPQEEEQPVETALMQIGELEVKPLDSTAPDKDLN